MVILSISKKVSTVVSTQVTPLRANVIHERPLSHHHSCERETYHILCFQAISTAQPWIVSKRLVVMNNYSHGVLVVNFPKILLQYLLPSLDAKIINQIGYMTQRTQDKTCMNGY